MKVLVYQLPKKGMPVLFILSQYWQENSTQQQTTTTGATSTATNRKNHLALHWNFRILDI